MKASILLPLINYLVTTTASPTPHLTPRRPSTHKLSHTSPSSSSPNHHSLLATTESSKAGYSLSGQGGPRDTVLHAETVFTIPFAEPPTTGPTAGLTSGVYQVSYWVGIDGLAACPTASLRAGVDTFWDAGVQTANAWYEWYPTSPPVDFGNFSLQQGDRVHISVVADKDGKGGTLSVEKLRVNDDPTQDDVVLASAGHRFDGKGTDGDGLCLREGNVVVEDYPLEEVPDVLLPLANFTGVLFETMHLGYQGGNYVLDDDPTRLFDVREQTQGGRLTKCKMWNALSVECKRVLET